MTEIQTTHYTRYHVRPGRWQALRHALTGHGLDVDGSRVSAVLGLAPGTQRVRVDAWGGGGGNGSPYQMAEVNGTPPPGTRPGKHRHGPARRICCDTLDGTPHAKCPVYTPGGYARPVGGGLQRICCPTMPGDRHGSECGLTAGQRAALADHEALSGPYEERLTVPVPSGQPWHCASCGGEFAVIGGRLVHSDPVCAGMTQEQKEAAARDARPGYLP